MQGSRCIRNIMVPRNMGPQGSDIPLSVSYRYHLHVSGHVYILGGGDRVPYVGLQTSFRKVMQHLIITNFKCPLRILSELQIPIKRFLLDLASFEQRVVKI